MITALPAPSPAFSVSLQGMALSFGLIVAIGAQNAFVLRRFDVTGTGLPFESAPRKSTIPWSAGSRPVAMLVRLRPSHADQG